MSDARDHRLLDALLDSWDWNNTILLNLIRSSRRAGWWMRKKGSL